MPRARFLACLGFLLFSARAGAEAILYAAYDPHHDAVAVTIAYDGTTPRHRFSVLWSPCDRDAADVPQVSARLVDQQGNQPARRPYRVTQRVSLSGLDCRPALLTLRLGRRSLATVDVPPPSTGHTASR